MRIEYYIKIKEIIEKRIREIDNILNADPYRDIITLRLRADVLLQSDLSDKEKSCSLKRFAKKEKELIHMAKLQEKSLELIKEKVRLSQDLYDCKNAIWRKRRSDGNK